MSLQQINNNENIFKVTLFDFVLSLELADSPITGRNIHCMVTFFSSNRTLHMNTDIISAMSPPPHPRPQFTTAVS